MAEIMRWIKHKRIWFMLITINVVCIFGFFRVEKVSGTGSEQRETTKRVNAMLEQYEQTPENQREALLTAFEEENLKENLASGVLFVADSPYTAFSACLQHKEEYRTYIQQIQENVLRMQLLGIMNQKGSFADHNLQQTGKDFTGLENITWAPVYTKTIQSMLDYDILDYVLLAFVLILLVTLLEDRKNGMWLLQRSCSNGRAAVTGKCIGVLALWIFIATATLYISTGLTSCYLYGKVSLHLPIQAVPGYQAVTWHINIAQYIALLIGIKTLGFITMAGIGWLVLILLQKELLAIGVTLVLVGAEKVVYHLVSWQSRWCYAKALNIWALTTRDDLLKNYQNLNVFSQAVSTKQVAGIACVLLGLVIFTLVLIIANKQYPNKGQRGSQGVWWQKLELKLLIMGGYARLEQFKIWFCQRGILIAIAFLLVLYSESQIINVSYSGQAAYRNELLKLLKNQDLEQSMTILEDKNQELQEQIEKYQALLEGTGEDNDNKVAIQQNLDKVQMQQKVLYSVEDYVQYLLAQQTAGYHVKVVNENGYQMLFTVSGKTQQQELNFYLLLFVVMLCAGSMAYENQRHMKELVHTFEVHGHTLFRKKIGAYTAYVAAASILTYAVEILNIKRQIGLDTFGASLQSLELFAHTGADIRIWQLVLLIGLVKLVLILLVMVLCLWISARFNKMAIAMVVCALILVIPSFLVLFGFRILSPISIMNYLCVEQWLVPLFI